MTGGDGDRRAARPPVVAIAIAIGDELLADRIASMVADQPDIRLDNRDAVIIVADALPETESARPIILIGDRVDLMATLHSGVAGVLPTTVTAAQLRAGIAAVAQGLWIMPGDTLADALEAGAGETDVEGPSAASGLAAALTARELEVLGLMAAGASNKVIARDLNISIHTAKFHVASILAKLDATGRTDAVAQAARLGLLML